LKIVFAIIFLFGISHLHGQSITFGVPVRVTDNDFRYGEPSSILCADPTNPNRLLGAQHTEELSFANREGRRLEDVFLSKDGGLTWTRTLRTNAKIFGDPDPACAFGPDGSAFLGAMRVVEGNISEGYTVWRSLDGGSTWEEPVIIDESRGFDRAFMVVDRGNTQFHGRLYIHGYALTRDGDSLGRQMEIVTYTSDDDARTFQGPFAIPAGVGGGVVPIKGGVHNGTSALLSDGVFLVSWFNIYFTSKTGSAPQTPRTADEQAGRYQMMVSRSADGGRTFDSPIVVGKGDQGLDGASWLQMFGPGVWVPTLAADNTRSPFRDRVYAAWMDGTSGRKVIRFSTSIDRGKSWSPARSISDNGVFNSKMPEKGGFNFAPNLVVNKDGVIGLFYYAQSSGGLRFWPSLLVSLDGGVTWSSPQHLTANSWTLSRGFEYADVVRHDEGGNVNKAADFVLRLRSFSENTHLCSTGFAADALGRFHFLTIETHAGRPQIYAVTALVHSPIIVHREVEGEIQLDLGTMKYDNIRHEVAVPVTITNVSKRVLPLPIRMVFEGEGDGPSQIMVANSDNHRNTGGAWWDFVTASGTSVLLPGQRTQSRTLRFRNVYVKRNHEGGISAEALVVRTYVTERNLTLRTH